MTTIHAAHRPTHRASTGHVDLPPVVWLVKHRLAPSRVPPAIRSAAARMERDFPGYEVENVTRLSGGRYVLVANSEDDSLWVKGRVVDARGRKIVDQPLRVAIAGIPGF